MRKLSTHEEAQRLAYGTVKNIAKVQVCNLRLTDNIEQIGHSDANIEWSSDEHLDWLSAIKTVFELFRTFLTFFEPFRTLFWMFRTSQLHNVFMCHSKLFTYEYTAAFVLSFLYHLSLLYCHYCSVMHFTLMPVSAYMALAFVFGFIHINWWWWWWWTMARAVINK